MGYCVAHALAADMVAHSECNKRQEIELQVFKPRRCDRAVKLLRDSRLSSFACSPSTPGVASGTAAAKVKSSPLQLVAGAPKRTRAAAVLPRGDVVVAIVVEQLL